MLGCKGRRGGGVMLSKQKLFWTWTCSGSSKFLSALNQRRKLLLVEVPLVEVATVRITLKASDYLNPTNPPPIILWWIIHTYRATGGSFLLSGKQLIVRWDSFCKMRQRTPSRWLYTLPNRNTERKRKFTLRHLNYTSSSMYKRACAARDVPFHVICQSVKTNHSSCKLHPPYNTVT